MTEKKFPMQDGPNIFWETAELIYKMYSDLFGDSQSLERIAQRGGFSWPEVKVIQDMWNKKQRKAKGNGGSA